MVRVRPRVLSFIHSVFIAAKLLTHMPESGHVLLLSKAKAKLIRSDRSLACRCLASWPPHAMTLARQQIHNGGLVRGSRSALLVANLQLTGTARGPQARVLHTCGADKGLLRKTRRIQHKHMACPARAHVRGTVCAADSSDYVPTDEVEVCVCHSGQAHFQLLTC